LNNDFVEKVLIIRSGVPVKFGRKVSVKTNPDRTNGYFDSKVLSRVHSEITLDRNVVYIQDLKSSNGTFVNGERISDEGVLSPLKMLHSGDIIDFGVDIMDGQGAIMYNRVSAKVTIRFETSSPPNIMEAESSKTLKGPLSGKIHDADELLALIQVTVI
jgi:pSer/pThr/pTyr-binding forkhead associated (FHA) protein